MLTGRRSHTDTLLPNGQVLVAGGSSANSFLTSAELYDPATGTWTPTGDLGSARYGHTATLRPDGRGLVTGGADTSNSGASVDTAELYTP